LSTISPGESAIKPKTANPRIKRIVSMEATLATINAARGCRARKRSAGATTVRATSRNLFQPRRDTSLPSIAVIYGSR
jgi:hypothetical protein